MSENKKIISIVESHNLKNKIFYITRDELEDKVKDIESFMQFIADQHVDVWWQNTEEVIEYISSVAEYSADIIQSYDDIKELIMKAFDENDVFVIDQGEEGSATFIKFDSFE